MWKGSWSDPCLSCFIILFPWFLQDCLPPMPRATDTPIVELFWKSAVALSKFHVTQNSLSLFFLLAFIIQGNPNCCKLFLILSCFLFLEAFLFITLDQWFWASVYVSYPFANLKDNIFTFWKNIKAYAPFITNGLLGICQFCRAQWETSALVE